MPTRQGIAFACFCALTLITTTAVLQPREKQEHLLNTLDSYVDIVRDVDGNHRAPQSAVVDTVWIAEWTFDDPGCDASGWQAFDNRNLNDGSNYWHTGPGFDGMGAISGAAAILSKHDLCWDFPDGYGNSWDYAIVGRYVGPNAALSFDYLYDTQPFADSVSVEVDSLCASNDRVDYSADPSGTPERFRQKLFSAHGLNLGDDARVDSPLPDFGAPGDTHCVYIRFHSDDEDSPEDGGHPTALGAALVVDNIQVTGGLSWSEDFEDPTLDANVTFVNAAPNQPFGLWARLHPGPRGTPHCAQNATCAWIFSDPTLPAYSSEMSFGPDGAVVRNWLDNVIVGPWVALPPTPHAVEPVLAFHEFGGNRIRDGFIARSWSLRGRWLTDNTDTPLPGDSLECLSRSHEHWNSLDIFEWRDRVVSRDFDPRWEKVQVRFRVADWQHVVEGIQPPAMLDTGPGPYIDRVRIGQVAYKGPRFEPIFGNPPSEGLAQDNFPSELQPNGHFEPSTDRFGSSDFARPRRHLGQVGGNYYFVTADSIVIQVEDRRDVGGVTNVDFYAAVVAGPHAGKAPPPFTVGANGFFHVAADSVPTYDQPDWFVDLDDDYFRGGDVLLYFWMAQDAAGGVSSYPAGITSPPGSVAEAEALTTGLLEVSFLPTIDWDPAYLERIAADPFGKLEPTASERANSSQRTCILYSPVSIWRADGSTPRRSGDVNRTAFMYTLDQLGYRGHYDVYDQYVPWTSTVNNPVASRATLEAATGYALIIVDAPGDEGYYAVPNGRVVDRLVEQSQWYQAWLAQARTNEAGTAALWIASEDVAFFSNSFFPNHVVHQEMGVSAGADKLDIGPHPEVHGVDSFTWANGTTANFSGDAFGLDPRRTCTFLEESYDPLAATGTATMTHRYHAGSMISDGAVIMNADSALAWNTVFMSLNWHEILQAPGDSEVGAVVLARKILDGVLPESCRAEPDPTTDYLGERDFGGPRVTRLHNAAPNPFNPSTLIGFDLARDGHVELRIYNVSGRLVRTLVNGPMERHQHRVVWDGLDDSGTPVSSGIYFYRLETAGFTDTRKMVLVR